jgi:hypothetical protein
MLVAVILLSPAAPRQAARADGLRSTIVVESYGGARPANAEGATNLAALATGGVLLYLDGKTPCDGPSTECPTSYDTRTAGLVLLGRVQRPSAFRRSCFS